jgi:hypothetical protein
VLLQQAGELVDRLNGYCESYYNSPQPQVSDAEYDAQLGLLQQLLGQLRALGEQGRDEAAVLEARSPLGRVVSSCYDILLHAFELYLVAFCDSTAGGAWVSVWFWTM